MRPTNSRARGNIGQRKKDKRRSKPRVHLTRVSAELKVISGQLGNPAEVTAARVLLNDLSPRGISLFCGESLSAGAIVGVTLEHPKQIFIRGKVVYSQKIVSSGSIVRTDDFSYRIGIEFTFQSQEEEKEIQAYYESIQKGLWNLP